MDILPPYTPTPIYAWTQTDQAAKRIGFQTAGMCLAASGVAIVIVQILFAWQHSTGAGRPGWVVAAVLAFLGLLALVAPYVLARVAQARESKRQDAYWALVKVKSSEVSTRSFVVDYIVPGFKDGVLGFTVHLEDKPFEAAPFVPLIGSGWVAGGIETPWAVFPEAGYVADDNGTVMPRPGGQMIIMSPVNEFKLQPHTELATATPAFVFERALEDL